MSSDTCTLLEMPRAQAHDTEKKTETLSTRVTPTILKQFKAIADADRRTMSFLLEDVVKAFLDRHAKDKGGKR